MTDWEIGVGVASVMQAMQQQYTSGLVSEPGAGAESVNIGAWD